MLLELEQGDGDDEAVLVVDVSYRAPGAAAAATLPAATLFTRDVRAAGGTAAGVVRRQLRRVRAHAAVEEAFGLAARAPAHRPRALQQQRPSRPLQQLNHARRAPGGVGRSGGGSTQPLQYCGRQWTRCRWQKRTRKLMRCERTWHKTRLAWQTGKRTRREAPPTSSAPAARTSCSASASTAAWRLQQPRSRQHGRQATASLRMRQSKGRKRRLLRRKDLLYIVQCFYS